MSLGREPQPTLPSPMPDDDVRELTFRVRLRSAGVEGDQADRLLQEWREVARRRELAADDERYWAAAADWLLVHVARPAGDDA